MRLHNLSKWRVVLDNRAGASDAAGTQLDLDPANCSLSNSASVAAEEVLRAPEQVLEEPREEAHEEAPGMDPLAEAVLDGVVRDVEVPPVA